MAKKTSTAELELEAELRSIAEAAEPLSRRERLFKMAESRQKQRELKEELRKERMAKSRDEARANPRRRR